MAGLIQSYLLAERPERLAAVSRLFSFRSMRDPAVANPVPRGPAARRVAAGGSEPGLTRLPTRCASSDAHYCK